jgi:coenzyme Q-binding protein COQ10
MGLVSDVENYTRFISLISALRVTKTTQITETHKRFEAEAVVAYKFISETFRSVVEVKTDAREIVVKKADKGGAVKSLINNWKFYELSDGSTLVDFDVDVRLKAFPLEMLARDKFDMVAEKIMSMFIDYAGETLETVGDNSLDLKAEKQRLGLTKPLTS